MARDAPAEFVPLFHAAMARAEARPRLDAFIKSLAAADADACIGAFFAASSDPSYHYARTDKVSLGVFAALALAAIDRSTPLYAVRFDALVHADKTLWRERFNLLQLAQQKKLTTRAAQQRKSLPRPQFEIVRMLPEVIRSGRSGEMEKDVDGLAFHEAHGCLLAYLEASLRYPPDNGRSLQVFMGLSVLTIRKGDADFVKQYRELVQMPGTTWSLRWGALGRYRDKVEEELRSRPLKVQMIEAGRAKGAVPVLVVTPTPEALRKDATRRDAARRTGITRKFLALFEAYMTPGGDAKAKKHVLTEYIFAQKLGGARECFGAYLEASTRYPVDSDQSLYIFWGTASRLIHIGKAYEALKLDSLRKTPGTLVAQRFAALPERAKLEGELTTLTNARFRRVLDDLRFEYWKRHRADADLASLRRFEPDVDSSRRDMVRSAARECDRAYNQRDTKAFASAFDAWADLMHGQKDPLVLVTMLKWCRDLVETPDLRAELYWYGVLALQIAARNRYPEVYDRGFSDEEKEFFLHSSLVPQGYRYDFERRIEFVVWKRARGTDKPVEPGAPAKPQPAQPSLRDVSRAHVLVLYVARKLGFTLVAMDDAARIRNLLQALNADKSKSMDDIRIPVSSRFPKDSLTLGATLGDLCIVWYDRKTSRVYVEMDGLGQVLFEVDSYLQLGRLKREDETYGKIWRDTRHLLIVIPLFYQIMGYLPDLVSGGFASLVTSVLTDIMVDAYAAQAGLGENQTMLLSFAANLGSGHMLDRMRQATGARGLLDLEDINELSQDIGRGTVRQADIPVAPRERATGGTANGLDISGDAPHGHGSTQPAVDLSDAPPRARSGAEIDDAPHKERAHTKKPAEKQRAARAEDADAPEPPSKEESGGVHDDRNEGGAARKERADPDEYNRFQGDDRTQPVGGSTDPKGTRNTGVKSKSAGGGKGGVKPNAAHYDLIRDPRHPILEDLTREGWTFEKVPLKQPNSFGGALHQSFGAEFEWRITSPSGEHFDADFLANNPKGGGVLIVDAKATRVTDPGKSGHLVFWSDKAEGLGRATALSLESDGRLTVDIVCNVNEVTGSTMKSVVGPETYMNVVNQQVAVELMERRAATLDRYYASRGKPGHKPTRDEVQRLVDRRVEVSDVDWGRIAPTKDPPTKRPRGSGPTRK